MRAFKNKTERKLWHADIKEENILTEGDKCVIIDWAGAIPFQESWENLSFTSYFALHNMNKNDLRMFQEIVDNVKRTGDRTQYKKYIELANGMDLFSVAMVLFKILSSEKPFTEFSNELPWPLTENGINPCAMQKLIEKKYGKEIEQIITKMLYHDYKDRYTVQEAIDVWEKIEL
jgi:serine/threonine protein kinase